MRLIKGLIDKYKLFDLMQHDKHFTWLKIKANITNKPAKFKEIRSRYPNSTKDLVYIEIVFEDKDTITWIFYRLTNLSEVYDTLLDYIEYCIVAK